jgi:5-aminolevulinate synthase
LNKNGNDAVNVLESVLEAERKEVAQAVASA